MLAWKDYLIKAAVVSFASQQIAELLYPATQSEFIMCRSTEHVLADSFPEQTSHISTRHLMYTDVFLVQPGVGWMWPKWHADVIQSYGVSGGVCECHRLFMFTVGVHGFPYGAQMYTTCGWTRARWDTAMVSHAGVCRYLWNTLAQILRQAGQSTLH